MSRALAVRLRKLERQTGVNDLSRLPDDVLEAEINRMLAEVLVLDAARAAPRSRTAALASR